MRMSFFRLVYYFDGPKCMLDSPRLIPKWTTATKGIHREILPLCASEQRYCNDDSVVFRRMFHRSLERSEFTHCLDAGNSSRAPSSPTFGSLNHTARSVAAVGKIFLQLYWFRVKIWPTDGWHWRRRQRSCRCNIDHLWAVEAGRQCLSILPSPSARWGGASESLTSTLGMQRRNTCCIRVFHVLQ
jgi:hypothetical protein